MRILPSGSRALLVEHDSLEDVLDHYAALSSALPTDGRPILDLVPAGRTIMVVTERGADLAEVAAALRAVEPVARSEAAVDTVEIEVDYDGEDLSSAADLLGLSPEELVRRHTQETWTVAFCGFAPGFGYLAGTTFDWSTPRRESPRTAVPERSVALAGEFSAVYPRRSPGGWQLIGTARTPVLELDRDPPGLFRPGMAVRFVEAS